MGTSQGNARRRRESWAAALFIGPDLIGLVVFVLLPILFAVYVSFFGWNLISPMKFIGLANYRRLATDSDWWLSMGRTLQFAFIYVPVLFAISLGLAVAFTKLTGRTSAGLRSAYLLPFAVTSVIASTLWMFLYQEKTGYLNAFLNLLGIPDQPFIGSPAQAMVSVVVVVLWINLGYTSMLFFSAIRQIPASLLEAARLDGANGWKTFWGITFPLIRPTSVFVVVTSTIASFQILDIILVMTRGGPANATQVGVLYIYKRSFDQLQMGYGSALSVVMFVILLVISLIQLRFTRRNNLEG
ncbi:MAG: sugar ABC transporter permease [Cellulomonas sp.]|uniref:carbohydrate ABC transporter permease n=1 Tax=Cellulomonas sp. 73-92 TaxID=1895740 RepID=UPI0009292154|nr:sugar ABC transporter permease [Cellulomonas sp. 73-92]MBN9375648.1 sugar ABC transporter permease [Cellulomonas sp.]OJV78669.1 MAG: sugar ABC transporter permease [Cellulomonas sp. 73-92]